jgi:hypothetical protein
MRGLKGGVSSQPAGTKGKGNLVWRPMLLSARLEEGLMASVGRLEFGVFSVVQGVRAEIGECAVLGA